MPILWAKLRIGPIRKMMFFQAFQPDAPSGLDPLAFLLRLPGDLRFRVLAAFPLGMGCTYHKIPLRRNATVRVIGLWVRWFGHRSGTRLHPRIRRFFVS